MGFSLADAVGASQHSWLIDYLLAALPVAAGGLVAGAVGLGVARYTHRLTVKKDAKALKRQKIEELVKVCFDAGILIAYNRTNWVEEPDSSVADFSLMNGYMRDMGEKPDSSVPDLSLMNGYIRDMDSLVRLYLPELKADYHKLIEPMLSLTDQEDLSHMQLHFTYRVTMEKVEALKEAAVKLAQELANT